MHVRQLDAVGDVGEKRGQGLRARDWGCHGLRLAEEDTLVGRDALRDAPAAIRPPHRHRVDGIALPDAEGQHRSEEHTSELQSPLNISYAVFCLKKKKK